MAFDTPFQRLKQADDLRPSLPAEHWLVLGAGVALFLFAARSRSPIVRSMIRTAATGLVARAAGGRDGILRVLR